jgi:hypothetical protein
MSARVRTYQLTEWALKSEAKRALVELEEQGWDRDLALATLEAAVGEEGLYDLPKDDEEVS